MEKIFTQLKKVALPAADKAALRRVLLTEMSRGRPARLYLWFLAPIAGTLALAFIVTTVAGSALPGDYLYALKIKFKEPVTGLLYRSSITSTFKFETQLVENRLTEAETLLAQKRLAGELKEKVKESIIKQTALAESLKPEEPAEDLKSVFKNHQAIVNELEI
jgi:hypothetical protein